MICPDGCGLDKPELSGYESGGTPVKTAIAQHTPLPWKFLKGNDDACAQVYREERTKGFVVASVNRDDDAEFIVRAVNLHENLLSLAHELKQWVGDGLINAKSKNQRIAVDSLQQQLTEIKNIIAQAEKP